MIIKHKNFIRVAASIKPDARKRVSLPKSVVGENIMYHVYSNSLGQIILDPQVAIPASEVWLFNNKEALDMVKEGLAQEESINLGSFARCADDAA
jgi:hypothetical protein